MRIERNHYEIDTQHISYPIYVSGNAETLMGKFNGERMIKKRI